MTNAQIIFNQSMYLMEQGIIKSTGRKLTYTDAEGNEVQVDEPEEIHTFAIWKKLGYSVKKGEHAVAKFQIWKHTEKAVKDEEKTGNAIADAPVEQMFKKTAAWFSFSQVEPIKE